MSSILYTDTEYSAFWSMDPSKSGELLQLASVPVVNGVVHPPFNEYCRPLTGKWSVEAQDVHKIDRNWAKAQQHPEEMADKYMAWIKSFDCRFTVVGFNCKGDMDYTHRLMGQKHLMDWKKATDPEWRDVYKKALDRKKHLTITKYKLPDLAKYFGLEYDKHNALADAYMTKEVDERLDTFKPRHKTQYQAENLSQVDRIAKYTSTSYLQIGGDGSVFIFDTATKNPEAMKVICERLWDVFVEGR